MFKRSIPLKHADHGSLRVLDTNDYGFARGQVLAPIVLGELGESAREYPIIFPDNKSDLPHVLLGLDTGQNAYVGADGRWAASYIPASIRRYPFALAEAGAIGEDGNQRYAIVFDPDSHLVSDPHGFPVFDSGGGLTEYMRKRVEQLESIQKQSAGTKRAVQALDRAGVLIERKLTIKRGNEEPRVLGGLRIVDETKLNQLEGTDLTELRNSAGLALAYAHLLSWANLRQGPLAGKFPVAIDGGRGGDDLIDLKFLT